MLRAHFRIAALICSGIPAMAGGLFISTASAAAIPVVDPSFELGTAQGAENTGGWGYFNGAGPSTAEAHTGTHSVELPDNGSYPGAYETYNIDVAGGAQFDLTAYGLTNETLTAGGGGVQATFFSGDNGGGNNLGTVESGAGNAKLSNIVGPGSPLNTWIPLDTGVFTAPAGAESMQIFAIGLASAGTDANGAVFVDDVALNTVTAATPEPASLGLLALGAVATLRRRRA